MKSIKLTEEEQTIIKKWFNTEIDENNFKKIASELKDEAKLAEKRYQNESWDWTFKEKVQEKKHIRMLQNLASKFEKHFQKQDKIR